MTNINKNNREHQSTLNINQNTEKSLFHQQISDFHSSKSWHCPLKEKNLSTIFPYIITL